MTKPKILIILAVLGLAAAAWFAVSPRTEHAAHAHAAKYQCPMHPQIVRDEPGDCPICHMQLQKVEEEAHEETAAKAEAAVKYQCPMHPQIVQDKPGDCPICHMHLQKVVEEAPAAKGGRRIVKYRNPMDPKVFSDKPMKDGMGMDYIPVYADELEPAAGESAVPDHAAFKLSQERRQLIGVRSTEVARQSVLKTLRLPGRVGDGRTTVLAQALEMDGGVLRGGLRAQVLVRGGEPVPARVVQVERSLDAFSRTFGVLLALEGRPDALMRPGVYVDVRVELKLAEGVAVPKEAVMDTGDRQWLFVQQDGGRFEPRAVQLGAEGDTLVEVRKGVQAGERVVTTANFLIDSESRFQSAAQAFAGGGGHD